MKTIRMSVCMLAALGLVLLLAPPASAANPVCGLNNGKPATGAPIPIGAVVSKTGPADFGGSALAAEAYFKCVNANGGIHGRPINYTIEDDGWNPEQAAQVAARLVRDKKVVAMVGSSSFVECGANEALYEAENVLVIAGVGTPRECFHSKNIAPTNAGPRMAALTIAEYMNKTFSDKKFVCIISNVPGASDWICNVIADWGKPKGIEVKNIVVDLATLDATSIMLQAAAFHPDNIVVFMPKEIAVALYAAAEQQGMGPKFHWSGVPSQYDPSLPKAIGPYWDGRLYLSTEFVPTETNPPDMQNWRAVMDKYGTDPRRDTFSQAGYIGAKITTEALLKLDPAKINRTTVSNALRNVKNFRSDILCDPWYFGPGNEHNALHGGAVVMVTKNGFVPRSGCIEDDDPELANIRKMEKELHLTK